MTTWREVTVTLVDRAKIQSALEYGDWFAKNAGGAIAVYLDDSILDNYGSIAAANQLGSTSVPEPLSDDLILEGVVVLDDIPVPEDERSWYFAPRAKSQILKLDKFVDVSQTGMKKSPALTGVFGELYGSPLFTSSRVVSTGSPAVRKNLYMHQQCMALVMEKNLNIEVLARVSKATTYSADVLFGEAVIRSTWGAVLNSQA